MSEYESVEGETFTLEEVEYMDTCMDELTELRPAPAGKRAKVSVKQERASPYPTEQSHRRPGRVPSRRDADLSSVEYDRLQRRRERNRHAAARCRERRMTKISELEGQVSELATSKEKLLTENETLQKEIEKLRFQLNIQVASDETPSEISQTSDDYFPALKQLENLPVGTPKTATFLFTPGGRFSLTPFQSGTMFDFPVITNEVKVCHLNTDADADADKYAKTLAIL